MAHNLGSLFRLLRARGFVPIQGNGEQKRFEGELLSKKGAVKISLSITDWNFLSYPEITLLDKPSFLPDLMPHIDIHNNLCYFASGSIVLDIYDPEVAITQCLDQATALIDRIASDPAYRVSDIQDEFLAHWEFGQESLPWPVLLGPVTPQAQYANYSFIDIAGTRRAIITSHTTDVTVLAKSLQSENLSETKCKCWIFKTDIMPTVPASMPKTIKELFLWLKVWDSTIYQGVQHVLEKETSYLEYSFISFAINTPAGWLGFAFDLYKIPHLNIKGRPKNIRPSTYRQHLHGKGGNREFLRLSITDLSPDFVHNRNLSFPDLSNKNIFLIGCGAIGSYLSHTLVKLGAGTGGGILQLIDFDTLQPENLGRHLLGYPSLFKHKSKALAEELFKQFPFSNIQYSVDNIASYPKNKLFNSTLVIDATGDEAVSEFLNKTRLDLNTKVPLMHVWIKGNGDCVQALWTDNSGGGCFRCLKSTDPLHYRQDRFPVLKTHPERRHYRGCHAFTPYAVASPIQAAALATDLLSAWLQGDPSPKFRTRSVETANVRQVKNQNITKIQGCAACGKA
jgi:hypothetical protein